MVGGWLAVGLIGPGVVTSGGAGPMPSWSRPAVLERRDEMATLRDMPDITALESAPGSAPESAYCPAALHGPLLVSAASGRPTSTVMKTIAGDPVVVKGGCHAGDGAARGAIGAGSDRIIRHRAAPMA